MSHECVKSRRMYSRYTYIRWQLRFKVYMKGWNICVTSLCLLLNQSFIGMHMLFFVKLATDKFVNPKVRHCNFNNLWIYIYSASMKSYWNIVHSIIHSCYFIVISAVIYLSEKPLKVRRRDRNSYLHSEVTVCYIVPHKRNSNIPMLKALDDPLHAKNWYKFWVYT